LVYIVQHLESVLRSNLANFMGLQETETLLENWAQEEQGAALIAVALPDPASRPASRLRFARVLRALVAEGTPITEWQRILETVHAAGLSGDDINPVVHAVRRALQAQLPGNAPGTRHIALPADTETELISWIQHREGKTFLALPPETTQDVLQTLRELIGMDDRRTALIVQSSELRPYLYRLASIEYPHLSVLARDETDDDVATPSEVKNYA